MAIDPAAISAKPATTISRDAPVAPVSPAARAKGTVRPSDMPMTISRTTSEDWKCRSVWGVRGTLISRASEFRAFEFKIFASIRFRHFGDLLGRAFRHDAASALAAFRAEID